MAMLSEPWYEAAEAFRAAVDSGRLDVPLPGSGQTRERWAALALLAEEDLSRARLSEGHADAVAILAELDGPQLAPFSRWGVWAAHPPGRDLEAPRGRRLAGAGNEAVLLRRARLHARARHRGGAGRRAPVCCSCRRPRREQSIRLIPFDLMTYATPCGRRWATASRHSAMADDCKTSEPAAGTHRIRAAGRPPAIAGLFSPDRAYPAAARARNARIVTATGIGGAALLGTSLSTKAGSPEFYILTIGVAGTWAVGAPASGPFPLDKTLGWDGARCRAVVMSVFTGAGAFGIFYGAARLARHITPLNQAIGGVLQYVDDGSTRFVLLTACAAAVAHDGRDP